LICRSDNNTGGCAADGTWLIGLNSGTVSVDGISSVLDASADAIGLSIRVGSSHISSSISRLLSGPSGAELIGSGIAIRVWFWGIVLQTYAQGSGDRDSQLCVANNG